MKRCSNCGKRFTIVDADTIHTCHDRLAAIRERNQKRLIVGYDDIDFLLWRACTGSKEASRD